MSHYQYRAHTYYNEINCYVVQPMKDIVVKTGTFSTFSNGLNKYILLRNYKHFIIDAMQLSMFDN